MAVNNGNGPMEESAGLQSLDSFPSDSNSTSNYAVDSSNRFERPTEQHVQTNRDVRPNNATQPVIFISDSELEMPSEDGIVWCYLDSQRMPAKDKAVWYYRDPQEMVQGPFSMALLRSWRQRGFFDENFRVWREGQSSRDAILLSVAIRNTV